MNIMQKSRSRSKQEGMTLVELMIAMFVLAVGMAGGLILMVTALDTNNRNRMDVNATNIAWYFLDTLSNVKANSTKTLTVTDCTGTSWTLTTAAGGATTNTYGNIDFTVTSYTTSGYSARYQICKASGQTSTYDVRWNIQTVNSYSKLITVGAMKQGTTNTATGTLYYAKPVTIRTIAGS